MAADTAEMVAARGAAVVSTREDDDDVGVSDEEAEYEDEEGQEAIETEDPVLWQLLSTTHAASPARPARMRPPPTPSRSRYGPAALYAQPTGCGSSLLAWGEDGTIAAATGNAAVILNGTRLAAARALAVAPVSGGESSSPFSSLFTSPLGIDGAAVDGNDRGGAPCLRFHLHQASATSAASAAEGGGSGAGAGGEPSASSSSSSAPVRSLALSPAGAAADGGCLLALVTASGGVHVMSPPPSSGIAREWESVGDLGAEMRRALVAVGERGEREALGWGRT